MSERNRPGQNELAAHDELGALHVTMKGWLLQNGIYEVDHDKTVPQKSYNDQPVTNGTNALRYFTVPHGVLRQFAPNALRQLKGVGIIDLVYGLPSCYFNPNTQEFEFLDPYSSVCIEKQSEYGGVSREAIFIVPDGELGIVKTNRLIEQGPWSDDDVTVAEVAAFKEILDNIDNIHKATEANR